MEIWKDIVGYEGIYQISNFGRVKTIANDATRKERILKPLLTKKGYCRVALQKNRNSKFVSIHRLVAIYFLPNPENKPQVNHIDGDKSNNKVENLEWCTYRENINHAIKSGLSSQGERNGRSKLSNIEVQEIRASSLNQYELAELYKVSQSTINRIKTEKGWK